MNTNLKELAEQIEEHLRNWRSFGCNDHYKRGMEDRWQATANQMQAIVDVMKKERK